MRDSDRDDEGVRRAIDHCRKAKDLLGRHGSFRTRVLLDMVLLELQSEMARLAAGKLTDDGLRS